MLHRRQSKKKGKSSAILTCNICQATFQSIASLNRHKKDKQHTKRVTGESSITKNAPIKKRPRTINDMLRQIADNHDEDNDETEDGRCAAGRKCIIEDGSDHLSKISWVYCEPCARWYHAICVSMAHLSDIELERANFVCGQCQ